MDYPIIEDGEDKDGKKLKKEEELLNCSINKLLDKEKEKEKKESYYRLVRALFKPRKTILNNIQSSGFNFQTGEPEK